MTGAAHVSGERLSAYWLGELDERDGAALEAHVFECEACAEASSRTAALVRALRATLPPVITAARLAALRARVPALKQAAVAPGGRGTVAFAAGDELFVLQLRADLAAVDRVDLSIELPGGPAVFEWPDAPFDREAPALFVLCQRHFVEQGFPPRVHMRLRGVAGGQPVELGVYEIDHVLSS